jgi:hypothetical protein
LTISIRNCVFAFRCDRTWTKLKKTGNEDVRFCGECQKEVHFCNDDATLVESIALNRCIAIRAQDHINGRDMILLGLPDSES